MTAQRAESLKSDQDLAERVEAFVARFGRLQDTLGDKLLPRLLEWLAEPIGPAIDNIARAERLGLIRSGEAWIEARQLRNFMIHEYVRDASRLASALNQGHASVPLLVEAASAMARVCGFGAPGSGWFLKGARLVPRIQCLEAVAQRLS
jgi:hypothetical protein